jgi:thioredoxin 1
MTHKNTHMKFITLLVLALSFCVYSFTSAENNGVGNGLTVKSVTGIKFTKLTLAKAIKQAQASGKIIFIDVHTSWCGPCKEMAKTTFTDSEVGDVFNQRFINLKIDAEQDEDGPTISRTYSVAAYPTLLFINGEGKLVKKLVGKQSKEKLLAAVSSIK